MLKKRTIEDTLLKVGVPAGVQGFTYITDAVMLLDSPEWKKAKFSDIYKKIGEMNGTTGQRAERCIRHAFDTTRKHRGETEDVIHYIGGKGTPNSDSVKMLYTRLSNETEFVEFKAGENTLDEISLRRIIREEVRELLKGILLGGDRL